VRLEGLGKLKIYPRFMKHEGCLPCSQDSVTCPCRVQPIPWNRFLFKKMIVAQLGSSVVLLLFFLLLVGWD
jgi:hypothetical protein